MKRELDPIADTTSHGGNKRLDGTFGSTTFQVGSAANESITVKIDEMSTTSLKAEMYQTAAGVDVVGDTSTVSGAVAVSVQGAGMSAPLTFSVTVEKGATQKEVNAALATMVNDANIGVGAFLDENDSKISFVSESIKDVEVKYSNFTASTPGQTAAQVKTSAEGALDNTVTMAKVADTSSRITDVDLTSVLGSQKAIMAIDQAIQSIDSQRADIGAIQNRFENTINNLQNIAENVSGARGRIKDTDFASETANLSKQQILQQAGTAILAQANQLPQAVLSLLR